MHTLLPTPNIFVFSVIQHFGCIINNLETKEKKEKKKQKKKETKEME